MTERPQEIVRWQNIEEPEAFFSDGHDEPMCLAPTSAAISVLPASACTAFGWHPVTARHSPMPKAPRTILSMSWRARRMCGWTALCTVCTG